MKRYLKWVFKEYYFKHWTNVLNLIATFFGLFLAIHVPGPVIEEYQYHGAPLIVCIGMFIATYGFFFGMLLYPLQFYPKK